MPPASSTAESRQVAETTADPPIEDDLPVTPDPNYYVELVA